MSSSIRIRVPKVLIENVPDRSETIREALNDALKMELKPIYSQALLSIYTSVYLGGPLASDIAMAHQEEKSLGRTAQGLLAAYVLHGQSSRKHKNEESLQSKNHAITDFFEPRPEQSILFTNAQSVFKQKRAAGIIEGATGTGKGRVLMAAAIDAFRQKGSPVVVCAPTIQIMSQLCREFMAINSTVKEGVSFSIVLGKDNYVSETLVREWLDTTDDVTEPVRQAVESWLLTGGGHVSEKTKPLHEMVPSCRYLAADFRDVAPLAPLDEITLSNLHEIPDDDAGGVAYNAMRGAANEDSSIVLTTHTMVILNEVIVRRNDNSTPILPEYKTLIVDEAHTLSAIAESVFAKHGAIRPILKELSDYSVWKRKRKYSAASRAIPRVKEAAFMISDQLTKLKNERVTITLPEHRSNFEMPMKVLYEALKPLSNSVATGSKVGEAFHLCKAFFQGKVRVDASVSPVMHYPSLQSGVSSLSFFFDGLWEKVDHLILASATCYLPGTTGKLNAGLITTGLHIQKSFGTEGIKKFDPVAPKWLHESPTLYVVSEDCLKYPSYNKKESQSKSDFDEKLCAWMDNTASCLERIYHNARGGVLVLVPSYDAIDGLAERLKGIPIVHQKTGGFAKAHTEFDQSYRQGKKTIWLATGAAWTGLDCSDYEKEPEHDFLVTDLVIPKIPFGVERSLAHLKRLKTIPSAERDRALFQFKQGLGRLIRRPGLRERNIWVLDARIWGSEKAWLYKPFRLLLDNYPKKKRAPLN